VTPDERTAIVRDEATHNGLRDHIQRFRVVDTATMATAAEWARQLRDMTRAVEERRQRITRPLLEAKREVDALFAALTNPLTDAATHLRREMGAHHARVEASRVQAVQTAVATLAAGQVPTLTVPEPVHVDKVTIRQIWTAKITDPDQVPRDYCSPDLAKVMTCAPAGPHAQPPEIPGVSWTLTERTTIR
jgi:hypothetical protein